MSDLTPAARAHSHPHVFLGEEHARSERNVWAVIALCATMMVVEIGGGAMFGSIALVADGFHMSTHAGAMLLAAIAYTMARRHADDPRFTFGTGKFGDLAAFASAIILALIAALIGYESIARLFSPAPIAFAEAIPIAAIGLVVNIASAWLLTRGGHHHGHSHSHDHGHSHHGAEGGGELRILEIDGSSYELSIQEDGVPPRWRIAARGCATPEAAAVRLTLTRTDGRRETYNFVVRDGAVESITTIPEPHAFAVALRIGAGTAECAFAEPEHGRADDRVHRDNNMRAAVIHVIADAAVSALVIVGLLLARGLGWLWMDPLAGLVGAGVIVSWALGLIRDSGAVLLDVNPEPRLSATLRAAIEQGGDQLADLHLWRLGPGHLGAILCIVTDRGRDVSHYRDVAMGLRRFSHLTIEILPRTTAGDAPRRSAA